MSAESIDSIVTIILAVLGALGGGYVSARLTKTGVDLNYKQLFEDATIKATRISDRMDVLARDALAAADREAKNVLGLAALKAQLKLMETQRVEQETRHAQAFADLTAKIAVLQAENNTLRTSLDAAMKKLTETEAWVDVLKTRPNPPPLSAADAEAIQTLRDDPPASEPKGLR